MDEKDFCSELKERKLKSGIPGERLAAETGITRRYLNDIEKGRAEPSEELREKLLFTLERLDPENPLEILFDYVRIRFPTMDEKHVIEGILKLKTKYMLHEDRAFYGYTEQYVLGDVAVMLSPDIEKGILLELKGKGCRQFETYLAAQGRSWYDFLRLVFEENGIMKRLDLAINDRYGFLDIPELSKKCRDEECISVFRTFKSYRSGELVRSQEQHGSEMGYTLYIGSMKSEVYFCIYEKDYEQYIKNDIPLEEAETKNRFEIRLKSERAEHAVEDLLTHQDAGKTVFGIINRYISFVDGTEGKRRDKWQVSERWAWFIGMEDRKLRLTTKPEPYTYAKTLAWLDRQVGPTLKVVRRLDKINGTDYLERTIKNAKLTERHAKIIRQQTLTTEELITD